MSPSASHFSFPIHHCTITGDDNDFSESLSVKTGDVMLLIPQKEIKERHKSILVEGSVARNIT